MRIGFDAKRAYQNNTGLGHYSRMLLSSLAQYFPSNEYILFAPKATTQFDPQEFNNINLITPSRFPSTLFKAAWRSNWVKRDLLKNKIDIYHGLSHEIPVGIQHTGIASVVTMHDLIFEKFPQQHKKIDRIIYRKKFKNACAHADAVIAISKQTRQDLIELYHVPSEKIHVCYQSCLPGYMEEVSAEMKTEVRRLYDLPERFFLSVGSIIERKNLLTICKAMRKLKDKLNIPLVVIGNGGRYKDEVKRYINQHHLEQNIIFLAENNEAITNKNFKNSSHFPAIYQMAEALIYPSVYEGFGLPVLEALFSKTPVVTSNVSCLPETGGDAALYIDPFDDEALYHHMMAIANDKALVQSMKEKGLTHAQNFTPLQCAGSVMEVYQKIKK